MQQSASDITRDMQVLHKEVLRNSVLNSTLPNSLLGGQPAQDVIQRGHYTPLSVCAFERNFDEVKRGDLETLEDVMSREFSPGSEGRRVVLHGGIGMGKTTAVEKIIWDWTSGTRLQHYTLLLRVCVEELSTLGEKTDSLCSILIRTHSHLSPESLVLALQRPQSLLLLLDGLKRFPNVLSSPPPSSSFICDVQHQASGTVLLCSLLHGSLLPGVSMLVTSTEPIDIKSLRSFEIHGFSKTQRRMFFQQFFGDGSQAERLVWHSEQALGVYEQCFCPSFCWTLCSVFKTQFERKETLPETLTHLFSIITNMLLQKKMNFEQGRELVSGLSRLAFTKSTKSEVIYCGLQSFLHSPFLPAFLCIDGDVTSPDTTSPDTTFSFLSPVMQEFLMAVSFYIGQSDILKEALEECTDLYYTFLAGLSDSGQRKPIEDSVGSFDESRISEFSQWMVGTASTVLPGFDKKQHFRVFRLLLHTRSSSLVKESISKSPWRHMSYSDLQESDCTALSYVVSCVGELEHMNLYMAHLTDEQAERLLPALRLSKSIGLSQSHLSLGAITHLATALAKGRATALDLSNARLEHGAVEIICDSLTNNTLQSLKFCACSLTAADCEALAGMLSGGSNLRVLDLFGNDLQDQGLIQLSSVLGNCTLHEINLDLCSLTHASMSALSSALASGYSELKTLNLSRNAVTDDGMDLISKALQTSQCRLNTLNVNDCELTGSCCSSLAAALQSEHCNLTELELSVNELGQSGMLICEALKAPNCMLEKLGMARCELTVEVFREMESVLTSGMSRLVSLTVGLNAVGDTGAKHMWGALRHKNCKLQHLDLEMLSLTDACVEELCESVTASSTLSTLSLKINGLTDSSVLQLVKLMQDHPIMSELNLQYNDFSEDVFKLMETCPKICY